MMKEHGTERKRGEESGKKKGRQQKKLAADRRQTMISEVSLQVFGLETAQE